MIDFCHIAPTPFLDLTAGRPVHLVLAHLIEEDEMYVEFYLKQKEEHGCFIIMDNSAFEMYKQGRDMYPSEKLIEMGKKIKADMIVLSDYPNMPSQRTVYKATNTSGRIKDAGFKTFFVPQSKIGDLDDYLNCMEWALDPANDHVDRIGLSILGCPNAYGVERDNKLQRFLSRWSILSELDSHGMLNIFDHLDIFHCLGMVDGPNEIALLYPWQNYIATWDSSAAVWAGLNGIEFDNSPTGLVDGKYETEVDFEMDMALHTDVTKAERNMFYIDQLCNGHSVGAVHNEL